MVNRWNLNFRSALVPAFILIFATGCAHQAKLPSGVSPLSKAVLPNGLEVQEYKLENGLQVLLVPNSTAPVFTFQLWVKAGSATEVMDPKLKRAGLAHLFEHMMFRGTKKHPEDAYDNLMDEAGATGLNATTWYDRTNYFVSLPKDRLDFALGIEADRFKNLIINQELFTKEIGAVLGEYKMGRDRPSSVAIERVFELVFTKHPYGKTTIGLEKDIAAFTVDEAKYFFETYYVPNNFVLLLVGDIQPIQALSLVQKHFGDMVAKPLPELRTEAEPEQKSARRDTLTHPAAENESVRLAFRSSPENHADTAALLVLATALGQGDGSTFQRTLVDMGLASSMSVWNLGLREDGVFAITAEIRGGVSPALVERQIWEGIQRFASGRATEAEVMRARNVQLLQSLGQISSNSGLGDAIAESLLTTDDYRSYFTLVENVRKVTRADVRRVAEKYLRPERSTVVVMGPAPKKPVSKKAISEAKSTGRKAS